MATQETTKSEIDFEQLVKGIATAVSASTAKAILEDGAKQRTIERTTPDRTSAYNPEGKDVMPKLSRASMFCGAVQNERFMKEEEILLFNQIKPGRYNGRKWEVIEHKPSPDETAIEIRIPVKEIQDRIELAMTAPSLVAILKLIIAEQSAKS